MADITVFPLPIARVMRDQVADYYRTREQGVTLVRRPVRPTDPSRTVAIRPSFQRPMGQEIGQHGPLERIYTIEIQALIKHALEEAGEEEHIILASELTMLAERREMMAALGALTGSFGGSSERPQKLKIRSQEFLNNDVPGNFLFVSFTIIDVTVERF